MLFNHVWSFRTVVKARFDVAIHPSGAVHFARAIPYIANIVNTKSRDGDDVNQRMLLQAIEEANLAVEAGEDLTHQRMTDHLLVFDPGWNDRYSLQ